MEIEKLTAYLPFCTICKKVVDFVRWEKNEKVEGQWLVGFTLGCHKWEYPCEFNYQISEEKDLKQALDIACEGFCLECSEVRLVE